MKNAVLGCVACGAMLGAAAMAADARTMATVIMSKGYDKGAGLGTGTSQFYDYAPDNRCTGRKRLYKFSPITGPKAQKLIPAGAPVVISGYAKRYEAGTGTSTELGVSVSESTCENRMSFTPKPGETYVLAHKVRIGASCSMDITEQSTGRPPSDLQMVDPARCSKS